MSTTSSAFTFPHPILTKLVGTPNNTSIQILAREVIANARAIPSIRGGGAHGHLGLVLTDVAYRNLTGGIPFTLPAHPGEAPTPPAAGASQFEVAEQIRVYKSTIEELTRAATLREELKRQILAAVDSLYLTAIEDATFGFATVSVADMITHLQNTYGTLTRADLEKNRASIATLWTPSEPLELLWGRLREVQRIATFAQEPIPDATLVELTHLLFEASGVFPHACESWLTRAAAQRTYAEFQTLFNHANKERLRRLQSGTTGTSGFHGANAATTPPVRPPVAPAAVPPPTPAGPAIANDGTQVFYCWTHGLGFNKNHTSATCSTPAAGHCQTATIKNMRGGNNTIMSNRRKPKPTTAAANAAGAASVTTPAPGAGATAPAE